MMSPLESSTLDARPGVQSARAREAMAVGRDEMRISPSAIWKRAPFSAEPRLVRRDGVDRAPDHSLEAFAIPIVIVKSGVTVDARREFLGTDAEELEAPRLAHDAEREILRFELQLFLGKLAHELEESPWRGPVSEPSARDVGGRARAAIAEVEVGGRRPDRVRPRASKQAVRENRARLCARYGAGNERQRLRISARAIG